MAGGLGVVRLQFLVVVMMTMVMNLMVMVCVGAGGVNSGGGYDIPLPSPSLSPFSFFLSQFQLTTRVVWCQPYSWELMCGERYFSLCACA
jgi:hypothetical protein